MYGLATVLTLVLYGELLASIEPATAGCRGLNSELD